VYSCKERKQASTLLNYTQGNQYNLTQTALAGSALTIQKAQPGTFEAFATPNPNNHHGKFL